MFDSRTLMCVLELRTSLQSLLSSCASVEAPAPAVSRDRILNDDEIKLFWQACEADGYPFGAIGKLLLFLARGSTRSPA